MVPMGKERSNKDTMEEHGINLHCPSPGSKLPKCEISSRHLFGLLRVVQVSIWPFGDCAYGTESVTRTSQLTNLHISRVG